MVCAYVWCLCRLDAYSWVQKTCHLCMVPVLMAAKQEWSSCLTAVSQVSNFSMALVSQPPVFQYSLDCCADLSDTHTYAHTCTCTHARTHTHMHMHTHACSHARVYAYTNTRIQANTHAHTCIPTCTSSPCRSLPWSIAHATAAHRVALHKGMHVTAGKGLPFWCTGKKCTPPHAHRFSSALLYTTKPLWKSNCRALHAPSSQALKAIRFEMDDDNHSSHQLRRGAVLG